MFAAAIQTTTGHINLDLSPGTITLVVGPNGVGKSAFLNDLYRRLPVSATAYYPGHRQITFSHGWENMQMSLADLDTNLFAQLEGFNRYKNVWPEEQFKAVLRRLQNSESAYNQRAIEQIRLGTDPSSIVTLQSSPMQILNTVFRTARMSVSFKITEAGITAVRGNLEYGVDRLSDGERAALFIVAAVANQARPGVVIIDEPERHLHPSISAPLISGAVRARPDQAFVFATHDLNLIETLSVDNILYIKDSQVVNQRPEQRIYDVRQLTDLDAISHDLKRDILGVRDRVLFVEGTATSLDMPLYSNCFPDWKVAPRGGHDKVQEAVRALNDNAALHWMQVVGIVDGDGRNSDEVARLKEAKIIVLPVPSVENLYFTREVVEQVCALYADVDGVPAAQRLSLIDASIADLVRSSLEDIVARRTAWLVNRAISAQKVSVADVKGGKTCVLAINIEETRLSVLQEITNFVNLPPKLDDIEHLPIKSTGIPAKLAELAGAPSLKKYKQTVLRQLEMNSTYGRAIKSAVVGRLPVLP